MSAQSDVEAAIVAAVEAARVAAGATWAVLRGWPDSAALDAVLAAGRVTVTVSPRDGYFRLTTRYAPDEVVGASVPTSLVVSATGRRVLVFGVPSAGEIVGFATAGTSYAFRATAGETLPAFLARIAAAIPGAVAGAGTIEVPGLMDVRVQSDAVTTREIRRAEQGFAIIVWAPTPQARDSAIGAIETALSQLTFLLLPNASARFRPAGARTEDNAQNASLYRGELYWTAEFPTNEVRTRPRVVFPGVGVNGAPQIAPPPFRVLRPTIGAIRFDAYQDMTEPVAQQLAAALSVPAWGGRLPWTATVAAGVVSFPQVTQAAMDADIGYARLAGLDYWAFLSYQPASPLSRSLDLYLASAAEGPLQFAMIGQPSNWLASGAYAPSLLRDQQLFSHPRMVRVLQGRPLYYVLGIDDATAGAIYGGFSGLAAILAGVRTRAKANGSGDPYLVWLDGDTPNAATRMRATGCDALGRYQSNVYRNTPQTYATLAADTIADLDARARFDVPMVPLATAGWDQRPLVQTPQPFYPLGPQNSLTDYYDTPAPVDLGQHVSAVARWSLAHRRITPAETMLLYAWNEFAEGGWVQPTLALDGTPDVGRITELARHFGVPGSVPSPPVMTTAMGAPVTLADGTLLRVGG